jgi:cephalosporin hydroxylase
VPPVPPERFDLLHGLVDSPALDLPLESWRQLYSSLALRPDLVLELGRGYGNSTCIFTEAAHEIRCRVVSIAFDSENAWQTRTAQRLLPVVGEDWFAPLVVLRQDLTKTDFRPIVSRSSRVLVFWDAHGTDVADAVLGRLIPALPATNQIVVDDIWSTPEHYGLRAEYQAGPLWSLFDELPLLWEYLAEREIDYEPGDRSIMFRAPVGQGSLKRRRFSRIASLFSSQGTARSIDHRTSRG